MKAETMGRERIIHPTFTCFDDALEHLEKLALRGASWSELSLYTVVHGICLMPDGTRVVHAWLEIGDDVEQDGVIDGERVHYAMPKAAFRERCPVIDETRYTLAQVYDENARSGHCGPWVERYCQLQSEVVEAAKRVWDTGHVKGLKRKEP